MCLCTEHDDSDICRIPDTSSSLNLLAALGADAETGSHLSVAVAVLAQHQATDCAFTFGARTQTWSRLWQTCGTQVCQPYVSKRATHSLRPVCIGAYFGLSVLDLPRWVRLVLFRLPGFYKKSIVPSHCVCDLIFLGNHAPTYKQPRLAFNLPNKSKLSFPELSLLQKRIPISNTGRLAAPATEAEWPKCRGARDWSNQHRHEPPLRLEDWAPPSHVM